MSNTRLSVCLCAAAALLAGLSGAARADMITGELVGVFGGNDKLANVQTNSGSATALFDLGKVDLEAVTQGATYTTGDLSLTITATKDRTEALGGEWAYSGAGTVQYVAVKAANAYALYDVTGSDMANVGLFVNDQIANRGGKLHGISHVSVYGTPTPPPGGGGNQSIPEPATAAILGLAAAVMLHGRRR